MQSEIDESGACVVTIRGRLDRNWADYMGNLTMVTHVEEDQAVSTLLSGPIPDFSAFAGLVAYLLNLGLPVQSISFQRPPSKQLV